MSDEQFVDNLMALAMGTTDIQKAIAERKKLREIEQRVKELE